jgi:hypothetical protein
MQRGVSNGDFAEAHAVSLSGRHQIRESPSRQAQQSGQQVDPEHSIGQRPRCHVAHTDSGRSGRRNTSARRLI